MKILIGKLGHETNCLSVEKGNFARWSATGWFTDKAAYDYAYGKTDYTSGMIKAAQERNVEVIPTIYLWDAGPLLLRETFDSVLKELTDRVRLYKDEIDGICLAIHGAGCTEGIDDIETYTLTAVREIVGNEMPITISLDLHGNLSKSMVTLAGAMFPVKEYPHTDTDKAGYYAMNTLIDYLTGKIKGMYTSIVPIPMLIAPAVGYTKSSPMKDINIYTDEFTKEKGLIYATFVHGFAYSNRYDSVASVVTVSSKSKEEADAAANELADYIWKRRELFRCNTPSPSDAFDKAEILLKEHDDGYVVISEISDNPGGGAPCDATYLLEEMVRRNIPGSIMGYIRDPEIARMAHAAGVGGRISGFLGAKTDNQHGKPIEIKDAYVCALSDGCIRYNNPMVWRQKMCYGKSARLRIGNVEVVVTEEVAGQTYDNVTFSMVGADIDQYRIVGVKSAIHYHAYFDKHAIQCLVSDPPGIVSNHLEMLKLDKIRRPVFPLDEMSER